MKNLSPDFKPTDRIYHLLRKHGCLPEFVDYEMDNFKMYWLDPALPPSKAKKESWDKTCFNWMRRAWKGKAGREWEYSIRHRRSDGGSMDFTNKPDLTPKPQKKRSYRIVQSESEKEMLRGAGLDANK